MNSKDGAFVKFGDIDYNWDPEHVCQSNEEAIAVIWAFAEQNDIDGYELEALIIGQDPSLPNGTARHRIFASVAKDFLQVVSIIVTLLCQSHSPPS